MDPRVQIVLRLISEYVGCEFTPDQLARDVNLSRSRLRHLFKRDTGSSITGYLNALRMAKAKELLETTFLNVDQVMKRVGIRDRSHFTRSFKKHYGLPPLKYRNKHLTKLNHSEGRQPLSPTNDRFNQ